MDYPTARQFLYGLRYHGAKYGLERMERFVEALGHPQLAFPVIHVAGTNGKGSTCAILEAILREAGLQTGLFTSPHLVRQGERIQVNRTILEEDAIARYTAEMRRSADALSKDDPEAHPSFFEFMTAMAFLHFQREAVDVAVVETGLGGRLDATNVVSPEVSVITSISLDHTEILGDTIEAIAGEKGGIIKDGRPVVLGRLPTEAEAVIRAIATRRRCPVHTIAGRFGEDPSSYPQPSLPGGYQRLNAATAALTAEVLGGRFELSAAHIARGLRNVSWAGRWESVPLPQGRTLILDASHNPEGAAVLDQNLRELRGRLGGPKLTLCCGTLGEARAAALMEVAARHANEIVLLRPHQPRALDFEVIQKYLPAHYRGTVRAEKLRRIFPAPGVCTLGEPGETIVATGSIYLVGEILEALKVPPHESSGDHVLQDSAWLASIQDALKESATGRSPNTGPDSRTQSTP